MPNPAPHIALIMSSFVSASQVGAKASGFCLSRLGVETAILPTTLMGRHPGWGAPGGGATPASYLKDMWDGIAAQDLPIAGMMTGYMATTDQVDLAVEIIAHVKAANPNAVILVDPVMGDKKPNEDGRLYIPEAVAQAIKTRPLPLASYVTPNLWELEYLTGASLSTAAQAAAAVREHLPCPAVVTSVPQGGDIGAIYVSGETAIATHHKKFAAVPHGGGDALAGTLLAHFMNGDTPAAALSQSVASIYALMSGYGEDDKGELPLIRLQSALTDAAPLPLLNIEL
ncbi:MAG: PfkB family carbohydrate kinase [Maricaulaceae bacterium]